MGNTVATEVKRDKSYNISTEKIQELQEKIRNVDDTMCGFVNSLDCLKPACEQLFRQCDKIHDKLEKLDKCTDLKDIVTDEKLAVNLLKTIEGSVFNQRKTALDSLGRLLNCLIDAWKEMITDSQDDDTVLSLNMYLSNKDNDENTLTDKRTFNDWMIESLQKEVKMARELNKININDIHNLEERDKHTREELQIAREKRERIEQEYKQLETKYKTLQERLQDHLKENRVCGEPTGTIEPETYETELSRKQLDDVDNNTKIDEMKTVRNELDNLKIEKKHLETELNWFKRKQFIHVQVCSNASSVTPVDDVLNQIEGALETSTSCKLHVIKLNIDKESKLISPDIPVLLFCNPTQSLSSSASSALAKIDGFQEEQKVALVVMHRETKTSSIRKSEDVLLNIKFKKLGGIFDIAYDFVDGVLECDMNKINYQGLKDFVEKEGLRKSFIDTFDLKYHR